MINITYQLDQNKLMLKYQADGHANYDIKGKDIICSAVSILTYTLAENVKYWQTEGLVTDAKIDMSSGHTDIIYFAQNAHSFGILADYMGIFLRGIKLLAKNYPQYLKISK